MNKKMEYRFGPFSQKERELWGEIMMDEMEVQAWFAVTHSTVLGEEIFMTTQ